MTFRMVLDLSDDLTGSMPAEPCRMESLRDY